MERTIYLCIGLILTASFGTFTLWTADDRVGMSRTVEFWIGVGGTVVGAVFLLMFAISAAVASGRRDRHRQVGRAGRAG